MKPEYIYMKVTHDKYELPLFVAETMSELSRMCGTSVANISHSISHREKRGWNTAFVRVPREEPETT